MVRLYVGTAVRLQCYFYLSSVLTDPTTITLKIEDPSGNIDTYTYSGAHITKSGTGDYYKNVSLDEEGSWKWRWVGTGTVESSDEGEVEVRRSVFV
jgi:hypothetical protein